MHTVEEAMTPDVVTVGPDAPVTVAARIMRDAGVSGLPVVDRDGRCGGDRDRSRPAASGRGPGLGRR